MTWSTLHRTYLLASRLAGPLARPILQRRLARGKEDAERIGERLGCTSVARPQGRLIWMHGASVGEAMSMLPLLKNLLAQRDDVNVLVTTGTVTSARRLADLLPDRALHQFVPVDTRPAVRSFLDHWQPDLAIWVESELWPRLVTDTARSGIPMALVNARFSGKTLDSWKRAPLMLRALLESFRIIRTQDPETSVRLRQFRIASRFAGNLKALIEPPECELSALEAAKQAVAGRQVWLAASTHPADEHEVIPAHRMLKERPGASPLLVHAPRHPGRGGDIEEALIKEDLSVAVRSRGELPSAQTDVWLADTLGEMGLWYRIAPVTFAAGSFGTAGGHTPFEPILLDSAVVRGPNVSNFGPVYAALDARGGALTINSAAELAGAVEKLLVDDRAHAQTIGAARAAHDDLKPDLDALTEELLELLDSKL